MAEQPEQGPDPPEEEIVGFVLPFLVTSAVTVGAVTGQAFTTCLMLEELHDDGGVLAIGIRLLQLALLPAGLLIGFHFWRTMGWIIVKQHREADRQYRQAGFALDEIRKPTFREPIADRPRWTPL